jgi:predicted AAA+ superfamily ATPase
MISRLALSRVHLLLAEFPAVALLGPRQVGKTTLARSIQADRAGSVYLDLERPSDLARLSDAELYLGGLSGRLVIIDEIQRKPDLFPVLRSLIDERRAHGERSGQFLLLGSASLDLVAGASESLAGRIAYAELTPILATEIDVGETNALWVRGGFPDSFLAANDAASRRWRDAFIRTYLERDIPAFAPRIPAETLRRFWTMLAHTQGGLFNASRLAASLGVTSPTVDRYLDLLCDLLLVHRLAPWHENHGKRLVKSPKVYIRDSGLAHALLGLTSLDDVLGHPIAGPSYEGFVVETIIASLPEDASAWFYRTSAGAEIDLVVDFGGGRRAAIEIKRSLAPSVKKGFHIGCKDIDATERYVVYPGSDAFPLGSGVSVVPLSGLTERLMSTSSSQI